MTIHLHPTAPLAPRVLLPGDPGRALFLAQELLVEPRMFNHSRGLWGYSGAAVADGRPLTIQSTGMGGPSAAIVIAELADLGAERLIRAGTCGGLTPELGLGELLVATAAIPADGTSRALGASDPVTASTGITDALIGAQDGTRSGLVASSDLFYDSEPGSEQRWIEAGAVAVEMETATLFALAARRGLEAGCALIVADVARPGRRRIDADELREAERRLGRLTATALATLPS